ncbi:hypothetical protein Tco_0625740 [Tanacetum coccineum]|uniref:Uncharacterized protein n=1 Tax=Tanacetum coccineum TaxID=301880 RepID=A0ABQ4WHL1_9ASTR
MDCYNYHKEGTFAQESSSKKSDYKNKESTRRTVHVETSTSTALVSYDGLGRTSASQTLAFLSSENTSSTNEVSTASGDFRVSTAGRINQVPSTPCAHDVAYSFFAQPTTSPQLENEDFQQMDGDDFKELDL